MNEWLIIALQMATALTLDKLWGEVPRWHPLVGFGKIAHLVESKCNTSKLEQSRALGSLACLALVFPIPLLFLLFDSNTPIYWVLETFILYLAVGQRSLAEHAQQIYQPLKNNDLPRARHFTSFIVSRETQDMSEQDITRATVESVLENGHDAVIASLFYFVIGGAPLVILQRLVNTLDAMWGYKTPRFLHFGWCAAKLDDALGFFSAIASCLVYGLQVRPLSKLKTIFRCAWQQSQKYKSKNGGMCMSVGAQVLGFSIGGSATYHGKTVIGVTLGSGRKVTPKDIPASIQLVQQASRLWVILIMIIGLLCQI